MSSQPIEHGTPEDPGAGPATRAPRIAVLIPCFNEETTVGKVIADFRTELPGADIYVFDNNSTDATARVAAEAGARVVLETRQGKGFVLAAMLETVRADLLVLVDGDSTYPASKVHELLEPIRRGRADQVVGARRPEGPGRGYRRFHGFGNRMVTFLVNRVFQTRLEDVMSGYRAFSGQLAHAVPVLSGGFDVETEFTLQSLEKGFRIEEVPVPYFQRPQGSESKLSTFRDGARVLFRIGRILKDFKPFAFFGTLGVICGLLSLVTGYPAIDDYVRYRYVYHVPLAILAGFLGTIGIGLFLSGVLLATLTGRFREIHALRRRDYARRPPGP